MQHTRSGAAALVAAVMLCLGAATAAADDGNTYSVFSCRGPGGAVNPAAGWSPFASAIPGAVAGNDCAVGGSLYTALPDGANGGRIARWSFAAPAGTRIVRVSASRRTTGLTKSQQPKDNRYSLTAEPDPGGLAACDTGETSPCVADLTDALDKQGLDKSGVHFGVTCNGDETNVCPHGARADFSQIMVGLRDATAPTVSNVSVRDGGDTSGRLRVVANAADVGGGLYRSVLRVDGEDAAFARSGAPTAATPTRAAATRSSSLSPSPAGVGRERPVRGRCPGARTGRAHGRIGRRGRGGQQHDGLRAARVPAAQRRPGAADRKQDRHAERDPAAARPGGRVVRQEQDDP